MSETCMLCEIIALEEALQKNALIIQLKYDGARAIVERKEKTIIRNRSGVDISNRYPELLLELEKFLPVNTVADAEIVIMTDKEKHLTDFNLLQGREHLQNNFKIKLRSQTMPATIVLFDLLCLKGQELVWQPIEKRLLLLHELFICQPTYIFSNIVEAKSFLDLKEAWAFVEQNNLEGLVLKASGSVYEFRRSNAWRKLKHNRRETVEITGFEVQPAGITLTGNKIRVACNGQQSQAVKELLLQKGKLQIEIEFLEKTKLGFHRFPAFKRVIE